MDVEKSQQRLAFSSADWKINLIWLLLGTLTFPLSVLGVFFVFF